MRHFATALFTVACVVAATAAQACVPVSAKARAWAQCSYKVASETGDHGFLLNFAKAKANRKALLPTAKPRWAKLERRIIAACDSYEKAAAADQKSGGRGYVPDDQFEAINDTSDIDKLVKKNA
ncbi:hypothetical protein V6U71_10310 [Sphingopyxis sp. J-6]|uniref:hypothetical protein n=1 Tax=Sphingopyxis sp. J-6 TaxID=3122054 RepID=UPI003983DB9F